LLLFPGILLDFGFYGVAHGVFKLALGKTAEASRALGRYFYSHRKKAASQGDEQVDAEIGISFEASHTF
tara:strand:+ start:732 stop:938 length:207 start_codon:yes stop_codon:yes gene_type:complete